MDTKDEIQRYVEDAKAYFDELHGESARAAAILAVASLDDVLEELLLTRFPQPLDKKLKKKVFGPGLKPFGTYTAKADVAEAFGFYGPETRKLLEQLGRVRNKFAHSTKKRSFVDPDILQICEEIGRTKFPNMHGSDQPNERDVRYLFIKSAQTLHELLEEALYENQSEPLH